MIDDMTRIVKGYRDRIQRGGGSVVVTAAGAVALTPLAGQGTFVNSSLTVGGNLSTSGTLTVSGTGTHKLSGPLQVDAALTVDRAASGTGWLYGRISGAAKLAIFAGDGTTNDTLFRVATGAAGSEVFTEALRIVNANGYVSVATRFGIGTAAPGYSLHNTGNTYLNTNVGIGEYNASSMLNVAVNGATYTTGTFKQLAANATAPVLVVKLGATPGGDALQVKTSGDTNLAVISSSGWIAGAALAATMGSNLIELGYRSGAPAAPSAQRAYLWWDEAAKTIKWNDSAGTVYVPGTITAVANQIAAAGGSVTVDASGYTNVVGRLGVNAVPNHAFQVLGNTNLGGYVGINNAPAAARGLLYVRHATANETVANFTQDAADATAPVAIIKGGNNPAATARLIELRNAAEAVQFAVGRTGQICTNQMTGVATVGAMVNRFPIHDNAGTLVGYVPVYAAA